MPWFQRKTRPWDSHWDIYFWSSEVQYMPQDYRWPCPDNLYLHVLHIQSITIFSMVAFGVLHAPIIECYRGDILMWHTCWERSNLSNLAAYTTWSPGPQMEQIASTVERCHAHLPPNSFLVPGDSLQFHWEHKQANDWFRMPRITAKSWKLY